VVNWGSAWTVHYSTRDVAEPEDVPAWLRGAPHAVQAFLDEKGVPDGLPFLLSPRFEYDIDLNSYFHRPVLLDAPWNTNANRARALAGFLTFLERSRGGRSWRDAVEDDHLAYHQWRRRDEEGPRVAGATWSQEVSHVNQFYAWAVTRKLAGAVPIPQRPRRPAPPGTSFAPLYGGEMVPATYAHDEGGERIVRLPRGPQRRRRAARRRRGRPRPRLRRRSGR